ncbi:MAG: ABC transporter permease [Acidobacteriota bacterium]
MKQIFAMMRREIKAYFSSPLAYAIISIFLIICSVGFLQMIIRHMMSQKVTITEGIVAPMAIFEGFILLIMLPAVSMRLLTEERKSGTSELLLTSPLSTLQIVLGKYLGSLSILAIMLILTFPFPVILLLKGQPELGPILLSYVGVFLLGATFLSIGLFTSSLTENQIISFLSCFTILILMWLEDSLRRFGGLFFSELLTDLSIFQSMTDFAVGVVDTKNIIFFLSLISFFLFLTQRVIDSSKWR